MPRAQRWRSCPSSHSKDSLENLSHAPWLQDLVPSPPRSNSYYGGGKDYATHVIHLPVVFTKDSLKMRSNWEASPPLQRPTEPEP